MTLAGGSMWRPARAGDPAAALDMLRHYEPVLAFTEGEMFFPMNVDEYVRRSALYQRLADHGTELLARSGELTVQGLGEIGASRFGEKLFLRFVERPVNGTTLRNWNAHRPKLKERRHLSGVGLIDRLGDAIARIPTPGGSHAAEGTVASAHLQYADVLSHAPRFVYYGRVIEERAYTVLNYHFFYAMCDWRSSFFGAGDHQGDWQQVSVFLANMADGYLEPAWVACESAGGVEVRSWDDAGLSRIENHPEVFVAAGSHAGYLSAGDFTAPAELEVLRPLSIFRDGIAQLSTSIAGGAARERRPTRAPTVPFVDYASGDGVRIGPGRSCGWEPVVIDQSDAWAEDYRGVWGPDERGAFAAGRSHGGPRYDSDGNVRRSWGDPVGWASLDRQAVPAMVDVELSRRIEVLEHDAAVAFEGAGNLRSVLPQLELEIEALEVAPGSGPLLAKRRRQLDRVEAEIDEYEARRIEDLTSADACRNLRRSRDAKDDHARKKIGSGFARPVAGSSQKRAADIAAGAVAAAILLGAVALLLAGAPWYAAVVLLIVGAFMVDNVLRGTFESFVNNAAIVLAVATGVILVYEVFWPLAIFALAAMGVLLLISDVRELRAR
jgi:hypothetical protein